MRAMPPTEVGERKRLVALVDVDEVLFPFAHAYVRWLRKNRALTIDLRELRVYDLAGAVGLQHLELVPEFLGDPAVLEWQTPIHEGVESLAKLADRVRLIACTNRRERYEGRCTEAWLSRHVPQIEDVIFTRSSNSEPASPKSHFAKYLGAWALIDDTAANLQGLPKGCSGLLMKRPAGLPSEEGSRGWPSVLLDLGRVC